MARLYKALGAYAVLAVLEWATLSDERVPFFGGAFVASPRSFALAILGVLFALTLLAQWRERMRERLEQRARR